ncbi:uracil-DNA glycosylase family protein [uncultured Paraglaciecola sp.]|uniref:uracil-DNA glycosylase family protein n=1 Tax=uncultured Paraglaciecola sp. TaxID=1765024 RepID=UPI0030D98082|tara:strand:- start:126407 stop:126991 length:585 start_codon:yes stop_codon:yes gene_type:complete
MTAKIDIVSKIHDCTECAHSLPFPPNPVLQHSNNAKLILIGQAPGIKAHQTNTPWNDASGVRLREWLNLPEHRFYDKNTLSIVPMGFCYPGKGKSGDLPPRKECAPKWHPFLVQQDPSKIILLVGKYAQDYYLRDKKSLTERIKNWRSYQAQFLPLPHPSPRNNIWLKRNTWFENEILPQMQTKINEVLLREST